MCGAAGSEMTYIRIRVAKVLRAAIVGALERRRQRRRGLHGAGIGPFAVQIPANNHEHTQDCALRSVSAARRRA